MNTFEILYQAFRARYSLTRVQELLDHGCRLAMVARDEPGLTQLQEFLGEPSKDLDGTDPGDRLLCATFDQLGEMDEELTECDAAILFFGADIPEEEALRNVAERMPIQVPCLWLVESDEEVPTQDTLSIPTLRVIPTRAAGPKVCKLMIGAFPELVLVLARNYSRIRRMYARRLIHQTATRNAAVATCSSLPVSTVPVIGIFLSLLATTGETLYLTASQLRLSLLMAAIHGHPVDFFDRIGELWPVIGGGFGWRTVARELVGFVPGAGWLAKAGVAYSGTWAVGEGARLFYEAGQPDDQEIQRELARRSRRQAALEARDFLANLGDELEDQLIPAEALEELTRKEEEEDKEATEVEEETRD